jgi:uncharacterized protein (DUF433 family)
MEATLRERAIEPLYSFSNASLVIGRPAPTVRRWTLGHSRKYRGETRMDPPLITPDGSESSAPLSFLNLIELGFLVSYRDQVSLPAIRNALSFAAQELHATRPLLEHRFYVHGRDLFLQWAASAGRTVVVNASRGGQLAVWPDEVSAFLETVDYDVNEGLAEALWPLGRECPVIVQPSLNAGYPTTTEHGIRTDAIASRLRAGWDLADLRDDLDVSDAEIDAARRIEAVGA